MRHGDEGRITARPIIEGRITARPIIVATTTTTTTNIIVPTLYLEGGLAGGVAEHGDKDQITAVITAVITTVTISYNLEGGLAGGDAEHGDESLVELPELVGRVVREDGHPQDRVCPAAAAAAAAAAL